MNDVLGDRKQSFIENYEVSPEELYRTEGEGVDRDVRTDDKFYDIIVCERISGITCKNRVGSSENVGSYKIRKYPLFSKDGHDKGCTSTFNFIRVSDGEHISFRPKKQLKTIKNKSVIFIRVPKDVFDGGLNKGIMNGAKIKYIDLFCGIGSFHNSFRKKGWECILASDIDETTHEVYSQNYGIKPRGDIYKIDEKTVPHYDILCAGFPCQAFSQAGKQAGFSDKRGVLFMEILRFAKYHKPKILALENVQGLLKHDGGNTFNVISEKINEAGYNIHHKVLKCSDYGIPQMRKRLIMICIRNDIPNNTDIFDLDEYERDVSLSEYLGKNFAKKHAYTIRCGGGGSPINDRHNWDGYWVDGKEYRLTISDAKKLQGFDEEFIMSKKGKDAWRHLGNTIPTIFTKIVSDKIEKVLKRNSK